jgi:TolB protein
VLVLSAPPAQGTAPGENGRIAFRRYFTTWHQWGAIFTVNPDGTGLRQVTHPRRGTETYAPDWSPNGRWIAFTRNRRGEPDHIFKIRPNGSHRQDLSLDVCQPETCTGDYLPAWSPDGEWIAFTRIYPSEGFPPQGISMMRPDGTDYLVVTDPRANHDDVGPNFSPRGTRLVFVRTIHDDCGCPHAADHAIFTVRLDGTGLRRLTPWNLQGSLNPDWSPNGRWIVFASVGDDNPNRELWLIHPDGTDLHAITDTPAHRFNWGKSTFSPEGTRIVASRSLAQGGEADVFVMHVDGTRLRKLTRSVLWESYADWGPRPA